MRLICREANCWRPGVASTPVHICSGLKEKPIRSLKRLSAVKGVAASTCNRAANVEPISAEQSQDALLRVEDTSSAEDRETDASANSTAPNWPFRIDGVVNNIVERRISPTATTAIEPAHTPAETVKKKRGRPKGQVAWNRGIRMSQKTKEKISATQRKRWQNPQLHIQQRQVQKGKSSWNRGVKASPEARRKMSEAKRFCVLPKAMKYRMSRSHLGRTHSPETRALLSAKLTGLAKTEDHKKAIAAGQRRRFDAIRLYKYIQACDQGVLPEEEHVLPGASLREDNGEDLNPEPYAVCSGPSAPNMFSAGDALLNKARKKQAGQSSPNDLVVQGFVFQLREFRALQQELAPWTDKFKAANGRRPRFEDVECTGIGWLIEKYKEYASMRQKLVCESGQIRSKIDASPPASSGCNSYQAIMNVNSTAKAPLTEGAKRMARALEYKQARKSNPPAETELNASTKTLLTETSGSGLLSDLSATESAVGHQSSNTIADCTTSEDKDGQALAGKSEASSASSLETMKNLAGAPPRVRAAMLAAAKYKKTKGT